MKVATDTTQIVGTSFDKVATATTKKAGGSFAKVATAHRNQLFLYYLVHLKESQSLSQSSSPLSVIS